MESLINGYIRRGFVHDPALLPLVNDTSEEDLLPQNFAGVNTICACLRARGPGRQEAVHG